MSSVSSFPSAEEVDRWLEYEAQLTDLAEDQQCLFLCHYTPQDLDSGRLPDVVCSHSSIIHQGEIAPNIYHVRSRETSDSDGNRLGFEDMLADAANRARIERLRRQREAERLTSVRRLEVALASCAAPFVIQRLLNSLRRTACVGLREMRGRRRQS